MSDYVKKPSMDKDVLAEYFLTPVLDRYDVIVCGGGLAGVAAAVSAARHGCSVILIEKGVQLGGLATSGLISLYEPICDGEGHILMTGMPEELLRLAVAHGPSTLPPEWNTFSSVNISQRCMSFFSPPVFALALDQWVLDAGVKILLDTTVVKVECDGECCSGVVVENKTGRGFYQGKMIIDATGDADLFHRSGAPCVDGRNYMTYIGYLSNSASLKKALDSGNLLDARKWVTVGSDLWGRGHPEELPYYQGTTAEEITEFILTGRKMFFKKYSQDTGKCKDVSILPGIAQLRTTRHISGAYELTEKDEGKHFSDSVGVVCDFDRRGKKYEIPYRILFNPSRPNLLTAGRTVSCSGWVWEVIREIPGVIATGQAAGTAAALCVQESSDLNHVDINKLRTLLRSDGVTLNI